MIIYKIICLINNKIYVGQTSQVLEVRLKAHARENRTVIGRAIQKYGLSNFKISIICEVGTREECNVKEQYYILKYRTLVGKEMMYNLTDGGGGVEGARWKCSEEQNKRKSIVLKGRVFTEEWKEKLSISASNRVMTEESNLKRSESCKKVWTFEMRERQSGNRIGKAHSLETKNKMAKSGRKYPFDTMVSGQGIIVPIIGSYKSLCNSVYKSARLVGKKVCTRVVEGGLLCAVV